MRKATQATAQGSAGIGRGEMWLLTSSTRHSKILGPATSLPLFPHEWTAIHLYLHRAIGWVEISRREALLLTPGVEVKFLVALATTFSPRMRT